MRVCIIGGGIMGLMTAYSAMTEFSPQITEVYLFDAGYSGSSVGELRALQNCYQGVYQPAVRYARREWVNLLRKSSLDYYFPVGNLLINQTKYTVPEVSSYQVGTKMNPATFDVDAGLLDIQSIYRYLRQQLRKLGVIYFDHTPITKLCPTRNQVYYEAGARVITYDRCIIATGAWTNQLLRASNLPPIPYRISLEQINMFKVPPGKTPPHNISGEYQGNFCYMYPPITSQHLHTDYIKVVVHTHPTIDVTIPEPSTQKHVTDTRLLQIARGFFRNYVTPVDVPVETLRCPYTYRDDGTGDDFMVGPIPGHNNIIAMVGFRGEGYKFSPTVSKLVLLLATGTKLTKLPDWWQELSRQFSY